MQEKLRKKPAHVYLPAKCIDSWFLRETREKKIYSPSFLPLSGTAFGKLGEAAVDGGEAGFSESMFARRLWRVSSDALKG